jgi:hypothetical protein
MVRRIILLCVAAGVAWYIVTRLRASQALSTSGGAHPPPAPASGEPVESAPGTDSSTTAATARAAPHDRIRSIIGDPSEGASDGSAPATHISEDGGPRRDPGLIKGNINRDGEKIYHLPGDPAYERTKAEQMFATIDEAEAAGFRRAGRRRAI